MAEVTLAEIKELRKLTGAGVGAVKEALEKSEGDFDKAMKVLREKGMAKAAKRAGKQIANGYIGQYVHGNGKLVVIVELGSETDFASKSPDFQEFANKLALHIAASGTKYVSRDRVPADELEKEKETYKTEVEGKPEEVAEKILEGKLEKFYKQYVLMEQELFGSDGVTVQDALNELTAKIGENMEVGRMIKMSIGGELIVDTVK